MGSSSRNILGSIIEGEVKNKTEFGLFLGLEGDIDGMVHLSDLDWKRPGEQVIDEYKKGDKVNAKVLDVDVEKERISLGIKQLEGDPVEAAGDVKKGSVVTCEVTEVKEGGGVKIIGTDLTTFIKRGAGARSRQQSGHFAVGQKMMHASPSSTGARRYSIDQGARSGREEAIAVWLLGFRALGISNGAQARYGKNYPDSRLRTKDREKNPRTKAGLESWHAARC
jgi:small subunit ribosomal protein S1